MISLPPPPLPCATVTRAPSLTDSDSSRRRVSGSGAGGRAVWLSGRVIWRTKFSVARTVSFCAAILRAAASCAAGGSGKSARACPISISPSASIFLTGAASASKRSKLAAAGRDIPKPGRGLLLREPEARDKAAQPFGDFERIQVFALQVFDERARKRFVVVDGAHEARHGFESGDFRRSPAALAGDDFEFARGQGAGDNRLQNAARADRRREFAQGVVVESAARLKLARAQIGHRHRARRAIDGGGGGGRCLRF